METQQEHTRERQMPVDAETGETLEALCRRLAHDRRQVVGRTKRLVKMVWQDRVVRTGPEQREVIRLILSTGLETEAMVEVVEALVRIRGIICGNPKLMSRRPAAEQVGADSGSSAPGVDLGGEGIAGGEVVNFAGAGGGEVSADAVAPVEGGIPVSIAEDDPAFGGVIGGAGEELPGGEGEGDGGHAAQSAETEPTAAS